MSEEAVKARAEAANVDALNKVEVFFVLFFPLLFLLLQAAEKAMAALTTKTAEETASASQSVAAIKVADEEVEDIDDI